MSDRTPSSGGAAAGHLAGEDIESPNVPLARPAPLPPTGEPGQLAPSDRLGALYVLWCGALTGSALWLAVTGHWILWLASQLLLAFAFLLWFVLLHETGHGTLFKTRWANVGIGYIAGFFSVIPFENWRLVHTRHHRWTGWQDMDATTESLTPRPLHVTERWLVNAAWRSWFPLFSLLYRLNNFWNQRRLRRFFPQPAHQRRLLRGIVTLSIAYTLLIFAVGPLELATMVGPALVLTLIIQEPIILSQHTHIPQHLARGRPVRPFPAHEQQRFTRSLRFPAWFSTLFLVNFDAHELHHVFVNVPGYRLRSVRVAPRNEVNWLRWLREIRAMSGEVFLFRNARQTGFTL